MSLVESFSIPASIGVKSCSGWLYGMFKGFEGARGGEASM